MEINQINMLDILRGIVSVPKECYSARVQLTTPFVDQSIPTSSMFIPPPLLEMVKTASIEPPRVNIGLATKSNYTPKPGSGDRYFWPIMIFLLLVIGLLIYLGVRMEKNRKADEAWEKLKEEQKAKEAIAGA